MGVGRSRMSTSIALSPPMPGMLRSMVMSCGLQRAHQGHRLFTRLRFAHHRQVRIELERSPQHLAAERGVVDDEDAEFRHELSCS